MGRTPKPVYMVVEDPLFSRPEFTALSEQGHTVLRFGDPAVEWDKAEVIIGPRCWRMMDDMVREQWITLLLKEARAAQPPRTKKEKVKRGAATS